ncbi:MAG: GGDEF domain-containing protein [Dehalobacter sp. 4CP]|nr:GGDEF domain-containing protein [Dehalobacter sp. 4CP]
MWFVLHAMLWKRKLFFILLVCITLSVVLPAHYVFENVRKLLIEETQSKATDIAVSIASFLIQDIESYRTLSETLALTIDDPSYSYYLKTNSVLRAIKKQTDTSYIFTAKYIDEQTKAYVLDGECPDSEFFSPFGSQDGLNDAEKEVLLTVQVSASGIVEDPVWGAYLTGYAPIIDPSDDMLVGWVGVDYDADFFSIRSARVSWILGICFTFFILSMTVILYYVIVAIHKKSATDYLTKLGNKRSFSHTVEALFRDAQHSNRAFALLMIDVNRFKQINDTFGHPAGDAVLKHIAGALAAAMESPRGCFRYGGDEFAILLANASPFAVELSRAAIHEEIEALTIDELHGYRVSVSIGMAMWEKGKTLQDLIDEADQDLYEQKKLRS